MKQTAFVAVTILAGLAIVFIAPQWGVSAEESPRLQRQGNRPPEGRGPGSADREREPMHNHKPPSHEGGRGPVEGGPIMDHLMRRFDEVIARLDRIERRVGAGHNPNGHQPPHGPDVVHGPVDEKHHADLIQNSWSRTLGPGYALFHP